MQQSQRFKDGMERFVRVERLFAVDGLSDGGHEETRRGLVRQLDVTAQRVHEHATQRFQTSFFRALDECPHSIKLRLQLHEVGLQHHLERQQRATRMSHLDDAGAAAAAEDVHRLGSEERTATTD